MHLAHLSGFRSISLMLGAALIGCLAVVGNTTKHPEPGVSAFDIGFKSSECVSSNGILRCVSPSPVEGCNLGAPDCLHYRASLEHRLLDRPAVTLAKLDQRMIRHTASIERQPESLNTGLPRRPD